MKLSNIKTVTMNIGGSNNGTRLAHHSRIGCVAALGVTLLAHGAYAVPGVTINSVAQRWPWNNKVDISYTITDGQDVVEGVFYRLEFKTVINGVTNSIDGATMRGASAATGRHTVTWTAPSGVKPTTMEVFVEMYSADAPSGDDYMVVDLDTGRITYEGLLATQSASNNRYNTVTYKTSKMAFRKVPAGTYYAKGKDWTTDRDYYIGIFECTRAQYRKIYGTLHTQYFSTSNRTVDGYESLSDHCPVDKCKWTTLRGGTNTHALVAKADGTVLERLNAKTQAGSNVAGFDLPTVIMSEIAARAGATTKYWWGGDSDTTKAACSANYTATYSWDVGRFPANGWGIFDASGNVFESCLDIYQDGGQYPTKGHGPFSPYSFYKEGAAGTYCVRRGGGAASTSIGDWTFEVSATSGIDATKSDALMGFRVAFIAE